MKAHLFKVALFYDKRTYRRIACLEADSLDDLHEEIFRAFDRYDEHMYCFYFPPKPSRITFMIIRSRRQYLGQKLLDPIDRLNEPDASDISIASLALVHKQKFYYLFDPGDHWWHEITYEGVKECPETTYPVTIARKGESPPQYPDYED
uniref:PRiA4b ORF-3-like protein n=1 Tax=Candidatus Kentrum sp. FM TaxID=2126340 RepID=A0A450TGL5_9GAMM|nr:MAG: pRiA4b ORF-3-like protein [Candidatus Kentron sp. FM]VFJ66284.1 MAG: pRiA4b ORF-3-like protein [Candidatus Kentron sp. FM]VFK09248.1 MAG: pRiA4b ORF-3-like protein [Candidatus Kentron sp. FM]